MLDLPDNGLYRTTQPMNGHEETFPAGVLVYVGELPNGGGKFVVRPGSNRRNHWFWGEPTTPLRLPTWARTLKQLPAEGFYTLPEQRSKFEGGGRWLKNAIVQLGYDRRRAQHRLRRAMEGGRHGERPPLPARGMLIDDRMLGRLIWAPILPVTGELT